MVIIRGNVGELSSGHGTGVEQDGGEGGHPIHANGDVVSFETRNGQGKGFASHVVNRRSRHNVVIEAQTFDVHDH